jgi:hypothetical protein
MGGWVEPTDIPGVVTSLGEVIDWAIEERSPIGYFAAVYRGVTERIQEVIAEGPRSAGGTFEDPARMFRFDVIFANRFLAAFESWRQDPQAPISESWRLAFETAERERTGALGRNRRWSRLPILVHLLLGVNAHMNLDLGVAASTVAAGDAYPMLRDDFVAINTVLGSLAPRDRMQEEGVAPLERLADRWHWLSGHVIDADIEVRREHSWQFGTKIAWLEGAVRDDAIAARDAAVAHQGRELLGFVTDRFWASPKHLLVRPLVLLDAWTTRPTPDAIRAFAG